MPLMSVNLRDSGGLASHMGHVSTQAARALREAAHSDLSLVCRDGVLAAHQCLLEPLSPRLSSMFQQHNCCNCSGSYCGRRETITLHLPDVSRATMRSLLGLIYTGAAPLSARVRRAQVEEAMALLDIALPGGIRAQVDEGGEMQVPDTPDSSVKSLPVKRPRSPSPPRASKKARESGQATAHPQYLLLQLTQQLMPFEESKQLTCNVAGCAGLVTPTTITSHFQQHFKEHSKAQERQVSSQMVELECGQCGKKFRFNKALEHHMKKAHCGQGKSEDKGPNHDGKDRDHSRSHKPNDGSTPIGHNSKGHNPKGHNQHDKKEKSHDKWSSKHKDRSDNIDQGHGSKGKVHSSKDQSQSSKDQGSQSKRKSPEEKAALRCKDCGDCVVSSWYLAPNRHNCTAARDVGEADWSTECQLCAQIFTTTSLLKTHITRVHYWARLEQQFASWGSKCSICLLAFAAPSDLVLHMGNVHDKVNHLLEKDGFAPVALGRVLQLDTLVCGVGEEGEERCSEVVTTFSALKMHLCGHFKSAIRREFPELATDKITCPLCKEQFNNGSNVVYHLGSVHNTHLKFWAHFLTKPGPAISTLYDIDHLKQGKPYGSRIDMIKRGPNAAKPGPQSSKPGPLSSKPGPLSSTPASSSDKSDAMTIKNWAAPLESDDSEEEVGGEGEEGIAYKCMVAGCPCGKQFTTKIGLRKHLVLVHYRAKLQRTYSGVTCGNCDVEVSSNKLLLKHVATKHESALTWVMGKDGRVLPWRKEKAVASMAVQVQEGPGQSVFKWHNCQICGKDANNSHNLKMHYLGEHYKARLEGRCRVQGVCHVCGDEVGDVVGRDMYLHFATRHPDTITAMMEEDGLWTENCTLPSYSSSAYRVKAVRVELQGKGPSMEQTVPTTPLKELLVCFLCNQDFNGEGVPALLAHYSSQEYRLELERNFVERPGAPWMQDKRCPECQIEIQDKASFTLHMGVEHRAVDQFLPPRYRLPVLPPLAAPNPSFPCPLSSCTSTKETKRALMVHLLIVHYQKDMEKRYGEAHRQAPAKCPVCSAPLLGDKACYMKHLAVHHEVVTAFVKRDQEAPRLREEEAERMKKEKEEKRSEEDQKQKDEDEKRGSGSFVKWEDASQNDDSNRNGELIRAMMDLESA